MTEVLLDTCALFWAIDDPKKLSPAAVAALQQVEAAGGHWYISEMTHIEFVLLWEKNKFPQAALDELKRLVGEGTRLRKLPINEQVTDHLSLVPRNLVPDLPDRIVTATAFAYDMHLVTSDRKIHTVPNLKLIW